MEIKVRLGLESEGEHLILNILSLMSQRNNSERNYLTRSPPKTDRPQGDHRDEPFLSQITERQLHGDSPTRHDVEFYVRKVNRYEAEIARLQHDLSVTKFRLSKAEDIQIKYDILFRENQKTVADCADAKELLDTTRRELDRLQLDHNQANQQIRTLRGDLELEKRSNEGLRLTKEQLRTKTTSQGQEERETLKEAFNRQINNLRQESRDQSDKMKREINELKDTITMKEVIESALASKLEHIKGEKNSEISRLKELVSALKDQLGESHSQSEENARKNRNDLINETEDRLANVRKLGQLIEETLMDEIGNLNSTLNRKSQEIDFLLTCDKRQLQDHENAQNNLRKLVAKLQDKIFTIQRENELQLYRTIQRLKEQYYQNLNKLNSEWEQIRLTHASTVESLKKHLQEQRKEIELLNSENVNLEARHKVMAEDQQHSVRMLSMKMLAMEAEKDENLRNYTTSMKQIEDDAKSKLDDLHTAIQNKNTENQILNAQINLKNGEITHLLEEIDRLRQSNRDKLRKLQSTNAAEQNALNNEISHLKKVVLELKRNVHELQSKLADDEAAHQLEMQLLRAELQSQKQANELLKSRNKFLNEWCEQLDRDLKAERVANVNILHDHNITHREVVQIKEDVRVELQAQKTKEVDQLRNIHKLEKNRLESELLRREHDLRDKKQELGRLLVLYKALQAKVGKSSKVDRSAEDEGKCRATMQAQILLTQNIFNAINRQ